MTHSDSDPKSNSKQNKNNSKNNDSNSDQKKQKKNKKDVSQTAKLAQGFFGLTIIIFAVYFALTFINETKSRKKPKSKATDALTQSIEGNNDQEKQYTEIQEKIFEKLIAQQELHQMISSIDQIVFKSQIQNQKINDVLKNEFQTGFQQSSSGKYNIEVDIFSDEDSSHLTTDEKPEKNEYDGTDTNIVLQLSFFDKKSQNKVGEAGVTIPIKMIVVK